ncbi:hypothetical protein A2Y85_02730 [candidate division WOR-3 bacterium RBG_13_43_14]|uniref:Saccharopine dehydrogenase n=1 Tax=candidate division WOR-3 bacterium RBG_13_43_14 TaxID=1802590 RepID=A0A1F4U1X2_UNCW3|nr:MAG: hypothetical protein A2Y85_02730 [candidate division WOR-3 bacterium RBG_13_43_14]
MKIAIIGAGMQGRIAAQALNKKGYGITIMDANQRNLATVRSFSGLKKSQCNVQDRGKFLKMIRGYDLLVGALPAALGYYLMKCAITAGIDLVDMSYLAEDPFKLQRAAKKKKIRIVPDAGYAPGLSNVLVGRTYKEWGGLDQVKIMVGGIPQKPVPPFNYHITWSPADLLDEYIRPTRIMVNRRTKKVPTLSGIEEFNMPGIGRLECFYTDGLRTLLKTIKAGNMAEKTIRYAGHINMIRTILDAGFAAKKNTVVNGLTINRREYLIEFLKEELSRGSIRDLTVLIIELKKANNKRRYLCIDRYDSKNDITSMARMTAYSAAVIAQCIKDYPGFGVIPPEYLGMNDAIYGFITREISSYNIKIKRS